MSDVPGNMYDDGRWYASTLGHFIGLLVDARQDPAVCFRVIKDSEPDDEGKFIREIQFVLLPDGHIGEAIRGCKGVHKTLRMLLEAEVIS